MSITINGRSLKDIVAEAKRAETSRSESSPITTPAMTERDGQFGAQAVQVSVETNAGEILLRPSPDDSWHVRIAHSEADEISVTADAGSLTIKAKHPPVTMRSGNSRMTFHGGSDTIISDGAVLSSGRTRVNIGRNYGVTVVGNGVGDTSIPSLMIEVSLPVDHLYSADLDSKAGRVLIAADSLRFERIKTETGAGDIVAGLANATLGLGTIHGRSGAGSIKLDMPRGGQGTADVRTGAGSITVRLPRGISALLHLESGLGKKVVEHPDLLQISENRWESGLSSRLFVKAQTGVGKIKVKELLDT